MPVKNIDKKALAESDFERKVENMKNEISGLKISNIEKGNT